MCDVKIVGYEIFEPQAIEVAFVCCLCIANGNICATVCLSARDMLDGSAQMLTLRKRSPSP